METKCPKAKTKTVLKSVSKWAQFGTMQNLKFQTFLNENHLTDRVILIGIFFSF